jgi:predicted TIM-barrel fold metal-dependent hydrolase
MPAGAVDAHSHVIGAPPEHPLVAGRSYTPPPASPDAYLAMLDAVGFARGVLIQVSVHGTDNRLLLQTLAAHPERLRGVAVMPANLPDRAYAQAHQAGVRGLRLNNFIGTGSNLYGGGIGFQELERFDALACEMGWHLQLLLDARDLVEIGPRIARLRCPWVIDHMGHVPYAAGVDHPGFQALVRLVAEGGWVKVSDAFRLSELPDYRDSTPFAQALLAAAPDRCLWGSDWPHVAHWRPMPTISGLLDLLAEWAPDEAVRNRVLVDNPARFYGF